MRISRITSNSGEKVKKILFLAMVLAGSAFADTRGSYVFLDAAELLNGDGFTRPVTAVSTEGPYLAIFKGNTVLSLRAATGVTFTATLTVPTSIKAGGSVRAGITMIYEGVTNSAGISMTAKVQNTSYSDAAGLTITTVTVYPEVFLNQAIQYGVPTMVDCGIIPNVYPGNVITLQFTRSTGSNTVVDVYNVYAIFDPVKGWLW